MKNQSLFSCFMFLLFASNILSAQEKILNGATYYINDNKWYCQYKHTDFEVQHDVLTVKFISGITEANRADIVANKNCSIIRSNLLGYYDLKVENNADIISVVEDFLHDDNIEYAEPSLYMNYTVSSNDPYFYEQWHLQSENTIGGIDAQKAWSKIAGSPEVTIAVLDSDLEIQHEDLIDNIWVNPGEDINNDGVVWDSNDLNGIDDDGNGLIDDLCGWDYGNDTNIVNGLGRHGTMVGGMVAAKTNNSIGIASINGGWGNSISGCKMMIGKLGGSTSDILDDAILYAVNNGASIITLSLETAYQQSIADAIDYATANNILITCASGNMNSDLLFPANNENTFAVGGSRMRDPSDNSLGRWVNSNYGANLKIIAPSEKIKTTDHNNSYTDNVTFSGTSFASPQVAATAGLIKARYPNFTVNDIKRALCITALKDFNNNLYLFEEIKEYGKWDEKVGYGKLNADRALGILDDINEQKTLIEGNYITEELHLLSSGNVVFEENSRFYLIKNGKLIIDEGAFANFKQDAEIYPDAITNEIIANGTIEFSNQTLSDLKININDGGNLVISDVLTISESSIVTCGTNSILTGTSQGNPKIIVEGTLFLTNQEVENLTIEIKNGGELVIDGNTTINESSTLLVQDGGLLNSTNGMSELKVFGSLIANPNSEISGFEKHDLGGITYRGSGTFALVQANITNTEITANCNGFDPEVSYCQFTASPINLIGDGTNGCNVRDNQFSNATGKSALSLESFMKFTVENNTFTNNFCNAISLYKSGNKTLRERVISNNTIDHNSNLENATGIALYASVADIKDNLIHTNDYGIKLYHNSVVKLIGDPEHASQQIYNNYYNQVYAADNSFPWYFKWNVVQDAGNPYAIISCRDIKNIRYDVRDNCWGEKFDPYNDLDPFELFTFFPAWDCGLNPDGSGTTPQPREKYELALTQIENENYTAADAQLKTIVNQWPESEFAATAMKTMPDVAQKRGNIDDLIAYYNTETNIQDNPELAKLAGYLKADCDVMKERYQQALDFYAGIIENPPTPVDETYATIDAGYVQYLMDENKAQGTFKYAKLIPNTREAYAVKRKQLLDALGGQVLQVDQLEEATNESMENLSQIANELNIYPNPTSGKVNIEFIAKENGNTLIEILNTSGQCVYSHASEQTEGKVNHSLSTTNIASGIYYVQVRINDKYVTGKKMVVY